MLAWSEDGKHNFSKTGLTVVLQDIKFLHTFFALPFVLTVWPIRPTIPWRWDQVGGILLCMFFARSFAMAVNRIADQDYDGQNPRTQDRALVRDAIHRATYQLWAGFFAVAFVLTCFVFWNSWIVMLAPVVLFLLGFYSFLKRLTVFCHFYLGAMLSLSPLAAQLALEGRITLEIGLLCLAILFWTAAFDIIYALADLTIDRQLKIFSLPAKLGEARCRFLAKGGFVVSWLFFILFGLVWKAAGWIFAVEVVFLGILFGFLIYPRPKNLFWDGPEGFLRANILVSFSFLAAVLAERLF